jgi:hypothetical protein
MKNMLDPFIGPEVQTMVVFLGVLFAVIIWGFFHRKPSE